MLEATLASLGNHFSEAFNIPKKQIGYIERDLLLYYLSKESLPLKLPAISYGCTDITKSDNTRTPYIGAKGAFNLNFTSINQYNVFPVTLTIPISLMSSKLSDYFTMIKNYFRLWQFNAVTVKVASEDFAEREFPVNILDISSLSTPAGAKEGKDFDRGKYFMLDGSLTVNSFLIIPIDSAKIIRRIDVHWAVSVFSSVDFTENIAADTIVITE